jgi:tetratricopeptide (TPR) repeat protein
MEFVPAMGDDRHSNVSRQRNRASTTIHERLIELSSWMMVIGTIRVVCAFANYLAAFVDLFRQWPFARDTLNRFADENSPVAALCIVWPLGLAIALRRTRWPQLLLAAGVTLLILALGGILELSTQRIYAKGSEFTVGSFSLTRRALLNPQISDVALILMGTIQLFIEFVTALRALLLFHQFRLVRGSSAEPIKSESVRRARIGRLATYISFGFLFVFVRLPIWATYLGLLDESRLFREFVLRNDLLRIKSSAVIYKPSKEERQLQLLQMRMAAAYGSTQQGQFLDAKDTYIHVIGEAESVPKTSMGRGYSSLIAEANNNLAWLLATCPNTELRDPPEALRLARRAVEVEPQQGNFWNTLGVAFYRAGELDHAKQALEKSLELRNAGDSFDWFFLALVDAKRGKIDQAREWYDKAVAWYRDNRPNDQELYRFNVEAAKAVGLAQPTYEQTNSALDVSKRPRSVGGSSLYNPTLRLRRGIARPRTYQD